MSFCSRGFNNLNKQQLVAQNLFLYLLINLLCGLVALLLNHDAAAWAIQFAALEVVVFNCGGLAKLNAVDAGDDGFFKIREMKD